MATNNIGVAIIGAGIGGLGMGMALKRELGFEDFVIYERDSGIGGTWKANTYPGCASDVMIHGYSFSTDLKPDWAKSRGSQAEILDYLLDLTDKHNLRPHCVFNTSVAKAEWDERLSVWHITTTNKKGEMSTITAKVLVSAAGILAEPNMPHIAGAETFKGPLFHSARYRHDVSLHGKKVAIIGNGCSAAQILPVISRDPTVDVTEFCRTPMWYVPGAHVPYSSFWKKVYATVPFASRLHRLRTQGTHELGWFMLGFRIPFMNKLSQYALTRYLKANAPKDMVDKMTPDYAPGCRRIIFDNEYLSSLHRPNNVLVWDRIERIVDDGIVTTDGVHRPFDVIIFATGFVTDKFPTEIRGRLGESLSNYYDQQGGPKAYLGSTVPGFPNMMLVQGPNTSTGHASVIFTEECQFNYAMKLFKPILFGDLDSIEPSSKATERYNSWLSKRLSNSVWVQCASWYRAGGTGKIFSNFPGPVTLFWWLTLSPKWSDYEVQGSRKDAWARRRRLMSALRALGLLSTGAAAMYAVQIAGIVDFLRLGQIMHARLLDSMKQMSAYVNA